MDDFKHNIIYFDIDHNGLKPELHKCSSQSGLPIKKVYCKVKPGYIGEPKVVLKIISDCGFSMRLCILFQEVGPTPVKDPILKKYNLMIENSEQSKSVERG